MKAIIKKVEFKEERKNDKFNVVEYNYQITWIDENGENTGYYTARSKDIIFSEGITAEFNTEERESKAGRKYLIVKLPKKQGGGNFSKALTREQSKYSRFAMSYAKDLVIAEKIKLEEIEKYTKAMFNLMVQLDKTLIND